jgi:DNA primase
LIWWSYALIFPLYSNGKVEFLQGRLLKGEPKYLNLKGIPKPLYNLDKVRKLPRGSRVHICEGVPDALALEAQGLAAVAALGATSFRPEWVDHFIEYEVVLTPDRDPGGDKFQRIVSELFRQRGKTVATLRLPNGKKDVAEAIAGLQGAQCPHS